SFEGADGPRIVHREADRVEPGKGSQAGVWQVAPERVAVNDIGRELRQTAKDGVRALHDTSGRAREVDDLMTRAERPVEIERAAPSAGEQPGFMKDGDAHRDQDCRADAASACRRASKRAAMSLHESAFSAWSRAAAPRCANDDRSAA